MRAANLVLKKPLFCKGAVLDIGQNLLHGLLCLVGYNLWSGDIIAVLSCIGNGITHACKTALVNQVHNQLHLMHALKVCILRSIACFNQSLKSGLHQGAHAAAEHCLLTKQVGLGLHSEGGLQDTCPCASDSLSVSQRHVHGLACGILVNSYQTWGSSAPLILASHGMARRLGSDHGNVHILRRNNLSEVDSETMGKHQHHSRAQVWRDGLLIHGCLLLIVDQNHDDICFFGCLSCCIYLESLLLCFLPGTAALIQAYNYVAS